MAINIRVIILPLFALALSIVCAGKPVSDSSPHREIRVTAGRYEFNPKTITVTKGERVRLIVTSQDVDHSFAIKALGITQEVKENETRIIELMADRQGKFEVSCSISSGDVSSDIAGELIVTEPQAGMCATSHCPWLLQR